MCQPWRWFWGLVPLALVALLALWFKPAPIASDLKIRAGEALEAAGHGWAELGVDGRDLRIGGTAPSQDAQAAAREVGASVWGVRTVIDASSLLALADPYLWRAELAGDTITIAGNVTSEPAVGEMAQAVREVFPDRKVDISGLVPARGGPGEQRWKAAADFALVQLAQLQSGTVSLRELAYSVAGEARSPQSYEALIVGLRSLPEGMTLAENAVAAPAVSPHRWEAEYDAGKLVMRGYAPDFAARDALTAAIRDVLPAAKVDGDVSVASGGIESLLWGRATLFALQQFSRLKKASAQLEDARLTLTGEAASVEDYESVLAALAGSLPSGIELERADIRPAPADTFAWIASLSADGLSLEGYVPGDEARAKINELAEEAFPDLQTRDRMRVARGPDEATQEAWSAGAAFAFGLLRHLDEGRALMTPGTLVIDGIALTPEDYDAMTGLIAVPPEGFTVSEGGLLPPRVDDFRWTARLEENTVTIEGYAPSAAQRNALVSLFGDARPGTEVLSTVKAGRGPLNADGFARAADFTARMFALFSSGSATLEGRALSIAGTARDVDAYHAAEAALENFPEGVDRGEVNVEPAAIGVLSWTATRDGDQIVLDGFVPSQAVRKNVMAAAQEAVPGSGRITDRMEIASGGPEAAIWGNATVFALTQLGRMARGQARLSGTEFSLQGVAPDFPSYDAILADVPAAMPGGLKLVRADILPPSVSPYVWGAKRGPEAIVLSGHVPSEEVRSEIAAFARERFSALAVSDQMKLASGAPEAMVQAVGVAFAALGHLYDGAVTLADRRVTLTGAAATKEAVGDAEELIAKRLPPGFSGTTSIRVSAPAPAPEQEGSSAGTEAEACQDKLNAIMTGNVVRFEFNSDKVSADSFALLDRIAEAAQGCRGFAIEVGGHTDADGSEAYNKDLSQRRAQSVVGYLTGKGVAAERLTAVGYGETQPVASNDNEAGKARNRRIAFTIVQ